MLLSLDQFCEKIICREPQTLASLPFDSILEDMRIQSYVLFFAVASALASPARAEWINRFLVAADVTGNQRFGTNAGHGGQEETPIIALRNDSDSPLLVRALRFVNSRYIGMSNPALDDWHLTFRDSLAAVLGMTAWDSNARVLRFGPPTRWSTMAGAFDRAGHPLHDTTLAGLSRFRIVIQSHSTSYLGLANLASTQNGFTFTMMTDWRLPVDDYGFVSTLTPQVNTIAGFTGNQFKNLAMNVEVMSLARVEMD